MNAFNCIGPAWDRMVQTCFRPFRFGVWAQLALVVLLAGEGVGGSAHFNGGNFKPRDSSPMPHFPWTLHQILPLLLVAAACFVVLLFVFAYLNARARFVLMDAVVERNCRLGEMWQRWREPAAGYFTFSLLLMIVTVSVAAAAFFSVWNAISSKGLGNISSAAGVILFTMIFWMIAAVIWLFLKDFVVPIMAFENQPLGSAWTRLRNIIAAEPGSFVVYILARIVLTIGCAIIAFMVLLPVLLIVAIPVGIVFAILALGMKGSTIAMAIMITLGILVVLPLILAIVSFVNVPFGVFFEAFALEFISYRLPSLSAALHSVPSTPLMPPATIPPIPPAEPSPI